MRKSFFFFFIFFNYFSFIRAGGRKHTIRIGKHRPQARLLISGSESPCASQKLFHSVCPPQVISSLFIYFLKRGKFQTAHVNHQVMTQSMIMTLQISPTPGQFCLRLLFFSVCRPKITSCHYGVLESLNVVMTGWTRTGRRTVRFIFTGRR